MAGASIDAVALREALSARTVTLNPPASDENLARLEKFAGEPVHQDIVSVYSQFDGFDGHDLEPETLISIWPIEKALADDFSERPRIVFADWFINAYLFDVDLRTAGEVRHVEANRIAAPTFARFWELLLTDHELLL